MHHPQGIVSAWHILEIRHDRLADGDKNRYNSSYR